MKLRINNMCKHFKTFFIFSYAMSEKSGKCNDVVFLETLLAFAIIVRQNK